MALFKSSMALLNMPSLKWTCPILIKGSEAWGSLEENEAIDHAITWVLGNPRVFLVTVGDIHLLRKVLKAADEFDGMPMDDTMRADLKKYGITPLFDNEDN